MNIWKCILSKIGKFLEESTKRTITLPETKPPYLIVVDERVKWHARWASWIVKDSIYLCGKEDPKSLLEQLIDHIDYIVVWETDFGTVIYLKMVKLTEDYDIVVETLIRNGFEPVPSHEYEHILKKACYKYEPIVEEAYSIVV